jgi:FSR family fosmidomycin resistance protein-like MFS transporter
VLVGSLLLSPVFMVVYVLVGGTVGALSACASGAVLVCTFSVTTVMSQEYLPTKIATAAGMSIGLAMGFGGVAAVILGAIADTVNLRAALLVTAAGPLVGALAAVWLPGTGRLGARPVLAE